MHDSLTHSKLIAVTWLFLFITSFGLLNIIVGNAIHNATQHGKRSGAVALRLDVAADTGKLLISVENDAGKNHAVALRMQQAHGTNAILANKDAVDMKGMGSSQSTYLGMGEMQQAAAVMGAEASLVFYPQEGLTAPHTLFSLTMETAPCLHLHQACNWKAFLFGLGRILKALLY